MGEAWLCARVKFIPGVTFCGTRGAGLCVWGRIACGPGHGGTGGCL